MQTIKNKIVMNKELTPMRELEQKIRKAIPELYVALSHGKPIQLNHVLEYCKSLEIGIIYTYKINHIVSAWNLKSNLLSEQSGGLIKFINEL